MQECEVSFVVDLTQSHCVVYLWFCTELSEFVSFIL